MTVYNIKTSDEDLFRRSKKEAIKVARLYSYAEVTKITLGKIDKTLICKMLEGSGFAEDIETVYVHDSYKETAR